jgi:hypothetical protein
VPVALRYRFADVAPSSFRNTTETSRLLLGAKGSRYGWDWESAFRTTASTFSGGTGDFSISRR